MYSSEKLNLQEETNHSFISEEQLRKKLSEGCGCLPDTRIWRQKLNEGKAALSLSLSEKKKKNLFTECVPVLLWQTILLEVFWGVHRFCLLGVNSSQTLRCCLNVYFNPTRPLNLSQDVQILPTKSHLAKTPNKQLFLSHHALKTVDRYLW